MSEIGLIFLSGVLFGGIVGASFGAFLYGKALFVEWRSKKG